MSHYLSKWSCTWRCWVRSAVASKIKAVRGFSVRASKSMSCESGGWRVDQKVGRKQKLLRCTDCSANSHAANSQRPSDRSPLAHSHRGINETPEAGKTDARPPTHASERVQNARASQVQPPIEFTGKPQFIFVYNSSTAFKKTKKVQKEACGSDNDANWAKTANVYFFAKILYIAFSIPCFLDRNII